MKTLLAVMAALVVGYAAANQFSAENIRKTFHGLIDTATPTPAPTPPPIVKVATPTPRGQWMYDNRRKTDLDRGSYNYRSSPNYSNGGAILY